MQTIDLSLAVNYIPACSCMARLFAYLLWLTVTATYASDDVRMFGVLGVLLYVDRVTQGRQSFFDGNSVLVTVYFAHLYQYVRSTSDDVHFSALLAYFAWSALACVAIWDSGQLVRWVRAVVPLSVPTFQVLVTAAFVLYLLFQRGHPEPFAATIARSLAFAFFVIVWVYAIGLRSGPVLHHLFTVRFLPLLVLPYWMALVFALAALATMYAAHRCAANSGGAGSTTGNHHHHASMWTVCCSPAAESAPTAGGAYTFSQGLQEHSASTGTTSTSSLVYSSSSFLSPPPTASSLPMQAAASNAANASTSGMDSEDAIADIEALFRLAKQQQQQKTV